VTATRPSGATTSTALAIGSRLDHKRAVELAASLVSKGWLAPATATLLWRHANQLLNQAVGER